MITRVGAVAIALLAGACGNDDPLAAEPCVPSDPAPAGVPVNFLSYVDGHPRNRTFKTTDLPEGATDSGMRRSDEALWRDIADDEFVYVISGDFADRYLLDRDDAIICR